MRSLRALVRLVCLALLTGAFYLSWILGTGILMPWARAKRRWRDRHFGGWARAVLRLLAVDVTLEGQPPKAPFVLVSNHLGYLDVVVLASCLDAVFVAKSEVAGWPVIGHLARSMGTLFIDRGSRRDIPRVVELMENRFEAGRGIVFFPEGTSTEGLAVGRFKPGLLEGAAAGYFPVHYASLAYWAAPGDESARTSICWWGDMEFGSHLWKLAGLTRSRVRVAFADEPIRRRDRKELAEELRRGVLELFVPSDVRTGENV